LPSSMTSTPTSNFYFHVVLGQPPAGPCQSFASISVTDCTPDDQRRHSNRSLSVRRFQPAHPPSREGLHVAAKVMDRLMDEGRPMVLHLFAVQTFRDREPCPAASAAAYVHIAWTFVITSFTKSIVWRWLLQATHVQSRRGCWRSHPFPQQAPMEVSHSCRFRQPVALAASDEDRASPPAVSFQHRLLGPSRPRRAGAESLRSKASSTLGI